MMRRWEIRLVLFITCIAIIVSPIFLPSSIWYRFIPSSGVERESFPAGSSVERLLEMSKMDGIETLIATNNMYLCYPFDKSDPKLFCLAKLERKPRELNELPAVSISTHRKTCELAAQAVLEEYRKLEVIQ